MSHRYPNGDRGIYRELDDLQEIVRAIRGWNVSIANANGMLVFFASRISGGEGSGGVRGCRILLRSWNGGVGGNIRAK